MCKKGLLFSAVLLAGCVERNAHSLMVPGEPPGKLVAMQYPRELEVTPASREISEGVARVGQKVVTANREIGLRPHFMTIAADTEEIFHRGRTQVLITDGLARRCTSEGQMAALISHELARMVVEREALTPSPQDPAGEPPTDMPIGKDQQGHWGAPDGTHRMELAKYEQRRQRQRTPPSTDKLAREYLRKAGYSGNELDEVAPLLRSAEQHATFERQMTR
jgi:hypothetical protein